MLKNLKFLGFWKILKNLLANLQSRQSTHVKQTQFLGFCLEPPGGDELPLGDVWMCGIGIFHEKTLFLVFLHSKKCQVLASYH